MGLRKRLGFTLVEVMITVTIVSILAALSLPMLGTYIGRSRALEATGFLAEIKARQEAYRADFGMYCSPSARMNDYWPTTIPGRRAARWGAAPAGWNALGASPAGGSTLFQYSSVAGAPGSSPNSAGYGDARGFDGLDFWFITQAVGDLDGDGITMTIESYSHQKSTWCSTGDNVE